MSRIREKRFDLFYAVSCNRINVEEGGIILATTIFLAPLYSRSKNIYTKLLKNALEIEISATETSVSI